MMAVVNSVTYLYNVIVITGEGSNFLLHKAIRRVTCPYRPKTMTNYHRQFTLFVAFSIYMRSVSVLSVSNLLSFLELLTDCQISPRVVNNYVSAIRGYLQMYNVATDWMGNRLITNYLRAISIHTTVMCKPKGTFSMQDIFNISKLLEKWDFPWHYRASFLLSFYAFLRISNVVPVNLSSFDPGKQITWGDIVFLPGGAKITLKWAKNLQRYDQTHQVHIPIMNNPFLCPVHALWQLHLIERHQPSDPVIKHGQVPFIEGQLRRRLALVLKTMGISHTAHTYHSLRRSAASIAFNNNIPLENIKSHGAWSSDAVYKYLIENSQARERVSHMFRALELPNSMFGEG